MAHRLFACEIDLSTENLLQIIQAMSVEPLAGIPDWVSALCARS